MNKTYTITDALTLFHADSRDVLRALPDNSVDSVLCDPPYHIESVAKRFGSATAAPAQHYQDGAYNRMSARFIGTEWDKGDLAFTPAVWAEMLRVLKPGGHLAAFSFPKTAHRMVTAIEAAGFEIREDVAWIFTTGQVRRRENAKPAKENICIARKPLTGKTLRENVAQWGVGALYIEEARQNDGYWPTTVWHDGCLAELSPVFYHVKANKTDRAGSEHPSVKPIGLLRRLCRLITPPGGVVLDPFAGSGTTGAAAVAEGFKCVLVEREAEYVADILARFAGPKLVPDLPK